MPEQREVTEGTQRLGRLLQNADFRSLLGEWFDGPSTPWVGPVSPETAHDVSFLNGKAAFVSELEAELREFYPSEYHQLKEERFHGSRRTS